MSILSADIGGTNCRFQLFTDNLDGLEAKNFPSSGIDDFQNFIKSLLTEWEDARSADILSIAAAGPAIEGKIRMTNAAFTIDTKELGKIFPNVVLSNDFIANGLACLNDKELIPILKAVRNLENGRTVILGAGTGLGTAYALNNAQVSPTEAGHCTFPFASDETEFRHFFENLHGSYVSYENILAGKGFRVLHKFMTGKDSDPEEFTKEEGFSESEFCSIYAKWTGRYCRQLALVFLPEQIIITGGIVGRNPALIQHHAFQKEFMNPAGKCAQPENISVFLNTKLNNGLLGAAMVGKNFLTAKNK